MLKPVDPALFLGFRPIGKAVPCGNPWPIELVPACPSSPPLGLLPLGFADHAFNAPTLPVALQARCKICTRRSQHPPGSCGPFCAPKFLPDRGRHALVPQPPKAGGVVNSGALLGATGGTQTHSRRTGRKLGRLRYARQGLVRVPESNTKYGGQGGKTGGGAAPVIGPSIGESSGIPKRKK
jgi:hypothetical protein